MSYKIKAFLEVVLISIVILLFVKEIYYFSATFGAGSMLTTALGIGFFLGLTIGWVKSRNEKDIVARMQITSFFSIALAFLFPLFASLSNHLLASNHTNQTEILVQKVMPYTTSRFGVDKKKVPEPEGFFVYFTFNGNEERIKMPIKCFPMLQNITTLPSPLIIPIKKGFLGYDFVEKDCN